MDTRLKLSLVAGLLPLWACTVDDLDLAGKACPCVSGWVCDTATNTCVVAGSTQPTGGSGGNGGLGGAGGVGASGGGGGNPGTCFAFRHRVTVTAPAGAPLGYAVALEIDHAALVAAVDSRADGHDLRIGYQPAGDVAEQHRVVDPGSEWSSATTKLWFPLQQLIAAAASDDGYFIYYGNPELSSAPADPSAVYSFWDDFDDPDLQARGWTFDTIGTGAVGDVSVANGNVRLEGTTGDIWDGSDNFVFLHRQASGDFVVDAEVVVTDPGTNAFPKLGGVMIRQGASSTSHNRVMSPVHGNVARTSSYRVESGQSTSESPDDTAVSLPEIDRLSRTGDSARAFFSLGGGVWTELGPETPFPAGLNDPVLIGIPLASRDGGACAAEVAWFRLRPLVTPEPVATLSLAGAEPGPFCFAAAQ